MMEFIVEVIDPCNLVKNFPLSYSNKINNMLYRCTKTKFVFSSDILSVRISSDYFLSLIIVY